MDQISNSGNDGPKCYIPKRFIFTLLGFLGTTSVFALRNSFSVVIVAMVNSSSTIPDNHSFLFQECPTLWNQEYLPKAALYKGEHYDWDAKTQGLILAAFYYGYIFTQIPGGFFAEKFGAKWIVSCGVLTSTILSLLIPFAVKWGASAVICVRVLQGFGEGVTFPAMKCLLSRWSPKLERSRISTIISLGLFIGNSAGLAIAGWLCSMDFLGGWPSVFYLFGICGGLWFLLWGFFIYETPMKHPRISREELQLFQDNEVSLEHPKTPWRAILSSLPFWAVAVAHTGDNFGYMILLAELPSYLCNVFRFDILSGGYLSAVPYLFQGATGLLASYVADRLRKSGKLSITSIRKIFNSIGMLGPSICLIGVTISGCRPILVIALISLALALNGCTHSGFNVTHVDMSPEFAGTLYGMTNSLSDICSFVGPSVVALIISNGATIVNWNNVFYLTAGIYAGAAIFYAAFASAEIQPWGNENVNQGTSTQKYTKLHEESN